MIFTKVNRYYTKKQKVDVYGLTISKGLAYTIQVDHIKKTSTLNSPISGQHALEHGKHSESALDIVLGELQDISEGVTSTLEPIQDYINTKKSALEEKQSELRKDSKGTKTTVRKNRRSNNSRNK